jgi:hypothetical protein
MFPFSGMKGLIVGYAVGVDLDEQEDAIKVMMNATLNA